MKAVPRTLRHPKSVRKEAAEMAREWANMRHSDGDPEGAECFRQLAREINKVRLTEIAPLHTGDES